MTGKCFKCSKPLSILNRKTKNSVKWYIGCTKETNYYKTRKILPENV